MTETAMWVIGQTIVLLIVIIGAAIKFVGRLSSVEAKVEASREHFDTRIKDLRGDHGELGRQVRGISRAVARLEGRSEVEDANHRAADG